MVVVVVVGVVVAVVVAGGNTGSGSGRDIAGVWSEGLSSSLASKERTKARTAASRCLDVSRLMNGLFILRTGTVHDRCFGLRRCPCQQYYPPS